MCWLHPSVAGGALEGFGQPATPSHGSWGLLCPQHWGRKGLVTSRCHVAITVLVDSWSKETLSRREDGNAELESSSHVVLSAGSGAGGSPMAWSMWAASGSCQASGQPLPPASLGLPADSWLSNVHTRMLPECCQTPASNVLCVLMDKININFNYFFFLFPFYLIFSSPEDFSLLFPPLAGTKITPQQGLDVAGGFVLSCSQAPAHLWLWAHARAFCLQSMCSATARAQVLDG